MAPKTTLPVILKAARGTPLVLEQGFFLDPNTQTQALVPLDPTQYPGVQIIDSTGQIVKTGVGAPVMPGFWQFRFMVPVDAALSTPTSKWQVVWNMLTTNGRTVTETSYFDVAEVRVLEPEIRAFAEITGEGTSAHVEISFDHDPATISAELRRYPGHPGSDSMAAYTFDPRNPQTSTIKRLVKGDDVVYSIDTVTLPVNDYILLWSIQEEAGGPVIGRERIIYVPPSIARFMFPSLRTVIDLLRKRRRWIQAYTTADLYNYLRAGVGTLNAFHPSTGFGLEDMPLGDGGTREALYCAAALAAMDAQHILAVETEFDFGGQTIPLKVDRRSGYEAAATRMEKRLEAWSKSKVGLFRRYNLTAVTGGRMPTRRFQSLVVPVGTGTGGEQLALLSTLGLL